MRATSATAQAATVYVAVELAKVRWLLSRHGIEAQVVDGLGLATLLVQEGEYLQDALGDNLRSFLAGFERGVGG